MERGDKEETTSEGDKHGWTWEQMDVLGESRNPVYVEVICSSVRPREKRV